MGERLSDRIAIGLLTSTFPPELVDRVVAEAGRTQQRSRLLPARVVVYFVLAMCLFFGQGYEEVARLLSEGLGGGRRSWRGAAAAAGGRGGRGAGGGAGRGGVAPGRPPGGGAPAGRRRGPRRGLGAGG